MIAVPAIALKQELIHKILTWLGYRHVGRLILIFSTGTQVILNCPYLLIRVFGILGDLLSQLPHPRW
ncbi:Uncharacterised protein [Mycobacterium tuberculosis]|nr:Uncharacterised protein [Mycobacterium tuberculosis]